MPSRSQGKLVIRARASSTATHANGLSRSAPCSSEPAAAKGGDQRAEQCMVEPEIETEENKDSGRGRLGNAAVGMHGRINPVAISEVPDESRSIAQRGTLERTNRLAIACRCE